ncbi:pyridoxal-phosphate dependent enzyme [Kocuria soli]|uniref:pyridoxal-phosphate dependent enzyme n=1 Tax=Kocuria soli TaxID=2485125 RepID=UPI001F3855DC|nr:pyridoxal-phosphate dependent enzyme [Kocuria soli]
MDDLCAAVGSTPLVRLSRLFPRAEIRTEVLAKVESMNPGWSAKDRPAVSMLDDALNRGVLAPGGTVIESSSGNLGISLARACTLRNVHFVCVVDSRANRSTVAAIRALGARIEVVDQPDPATGDLLTARLARVRQLLEEIPGSVNLYQYGNPANARAHCDGTMREIAEATGGQLDVMVAACSTTGTIGGCQSYITEHGMQTELVAVDAVGSVLFGGTPGARLLPGMGAGFVTDLSREVRPDRVIRVSERQCIAGARLLAQREGILAGASTGGVVCATAQVLRERPHLSRLAVMVHDGGLPYLETVYDDDWVRENLGLTPEEIETTMDEIAGLPTNDGTDRD